MERASILGILRLTDEAWPSDNTDPFDRLSIQDGFTYAYAPGVMMAWVTDSPSSMNGRSTSLEYRFLSSMQGGLCIGANLNKWTPEDFATARRLIAEYKAVRATVQDGALYRLISPTGDSEYSATETVARDGHEAAVFAFLHSSQKRAALIHTSTCAGSIQRPFIVFTFRKESSLTARYRRPVEIIGCTMESTSLYVAISRPHSSLWSEKERNDKTFVPAAYSRTKIKFGQITTTAQSDQRRCG